MKRTSLFLFCALLVSCGPKVTLSPGAEEKGLRSIALLPAEYPSGIRRERIDYIRETLAAELESRGFTLLNDKVVARACSTPECPERETLSRNYGVDAFVDLDVESISQNDFLAGYYNAIEGDLEIEDRTGKTIVEVEHTERERGGLIFQTGQVLQGVIEQIRNTGDESSDALANKFVRSLVEELPAGIAGAGADDDGSGAALAINDVGLRSRGRGLYEVCADATPAMQASLAIGQRRSNLRETKNGQYCGVYRLAGFSGPFAVELRSPYGNALRKEVEMPQVAPCRIQDKVKLVRGSSGAEIKILCTRTGHGTPVNDCAEMQSCEGTRFAIYRAREETGPFVKMTEIRTTRWRDPAPAAAKARYEVVAVSPAGVRSLPVAAVEDSKKE